MDNISQFRKTFSAGDVLLQEGKVCDSFFILESGTLEVQILGKKVATITTQGDIEFVGEVAALLGTKRTATVICSTDASALHIPTADLESIISSSPSLGVKLARSFARKLVQVNNVRLETTGHDAI